MDIISDQMCVSFFIYSFIGWLFESVICSIVGEGRLINKGFFVGPYCPIYGFGAIFCYICFSRVNNLSLLFTLSSFLCGILEYFTGYSMEKIFHAKWWDYSNLPFHIHGRVCLFGLILFGSASTFVCRISQPYILGLMRFADIVMLHAVSSILSLIFSIDFIYTLVNWINLRESIQLLYERWHSEMNQPKEDLQAIHLLHKVQFKIEEKTDGLNVMLQNRKIRIPKSELRFFHAFPNMRMLSYDGFVKKIRLREHIKNIFDKRNEKCVEDERLDIESGQK